jgi:uncharacterized protein involved in type VI secretion and phage assembly
MSFLEPDHDGQRTLADASGRLYGVVVGVVTNNQDPDGLGRVKLQLPWLASDAESTWARVAAPMAGAGRGTFFLPEVDDEVLVAFEHGDPRYPYVLGALWNGKDKPPEANADGQNNRRLVRSRSGMTILLDDESGREQVRIADKDGQTAIVISMADKKVSIASGGDVEIAAPQGTVTVTGKAVKLSSDGGMDMTASQTLNLEGGTVNVKGRPTVNLN